MRRSVCVVLALLVSACSGGGSTPAPQSSAPAKPTGSPSKVSVMLRIPAPVASPAAVPAATSRFAAAGRRSRPQLISAASNGLAIQLYSDSTHATLEEEADVDISGANTTAGTTCTADVGGGRSCTIGITEPAGSYDFVISTYAAAPGSNGFNGATSLDSGDAGQQSLTAGNVTTISVTLGGTIASLKLNAPSSIDAFGSSTVPIGIVAFDAAGEIIISSTAYSNEPISVTASSAKQLSTGLELDNAYFSSTVLSTMQTDTISLIYGGGGTANTGDVVTVTASFLTAAGTTATATAQIAALSITAANPNVTAASAPTLSLNSATGQDVVTFGEAGFAGTYTIAPDPVKGCVTNGGGTASAASPLLFTYNSTTSTTPPATLTASGSGTASFTVGTSGIATPTAGCVYRISDGSNTVITFTIVAYPPGSYTACPGTHLYVNNDNTGLASYALPLTSNSTPTQLEGQDQTVWLAFDPSCNAYIPVYYGGVNEFASPYSGAATASYTAFTGLIYGVAVDGAGHVFLDETSNNQVVELSSFSNSATTLATLPVSSPYALAFDSKANLYVGGSQGISVYDYPYNETSPSLTILAGTNIQGVAFDANGNLFAAGGNTLYEIAAPYGTNNTIATNTQGLSTPLGLAVDPATGDVYAPNYGGNTITGYAPPYTGAPFATVSGSLPDADAIGP